MATEVAAPEEVPMSDQPLTQDERAEIRRLHGQDALSREPRCALSGVLWPCQMQRLLDALEAAEAEVERLYYALGCYADIARGFERELRTTPGGGPPAADA